MKSFNFIPAITIFTVQRFVEDDNGEFIKDSSPIEFPLAIDFQFLESFMYTD